MASADVFVPHLMAFIYIFFIAAATAIVLKKIKFPYTIGLVVVGIVFAAFTANNEHLQAIKDIHLNHDIILYLILPTLIFDAAVNIDGRMLLKDLIPVVALAAPGLIISTFIVGLFMNLWTPLGVGTAFLFGALISATDPVAVIALFNEIGAPKRLTLLVDGESLFNDATAIVTFTIVMGIIVSGTSVTGTTLFGAGVSFITVFVGGLIVGIMIGWVVTKLINIVPNEPPIQIALTTVTAYLAFIVAEYHLGLSGVMSTLGAGLVVSWNGSTKLSNEVNKYIRQFWEYAAFVANSFIFLLIGVTEFNLLIENGHSKGLFKYLIIGILVVNFARLIVVYGIIPLLKFLPGHEIISSKYQTIIFWGGLRGAVPLALVLSLHPDVPNRQLIIELTLGIVLFSLLVQGTTTKKADFNF